ncbi:MAG: hypothetical protein L3K17_07520 [Thermoplasmata archaeon]|nr:hypothetical protein [Thermoplasmata archaeon]
MSRTEAALLTVSLVGTGVAIDGVLLSTVGTGSLLPQIAAGPLTWGIAFLGGLVGLTAGLGIGRRVVDVVRQVAPRMYPYASTTVNVGLFLVVLLGAVAVFAGFFELFSGAHDNGNLDQVTNQSAISLLLDGATFLIWVVTIYAVWLIHRLVSIGRYLDSPAAGASVEGSSDGPAERPGPPRSGWVEGAPGGPRGWWTLVIVGVGLSVPISAGIQILEVGVAPATPLEWLFGLAFLPVFVLPAVGVIGAIDHGVRDLERRYSRAMSFPPPGAVGAPLAGQSSPDG